MQCSHPIPSHPIPFLLHFYSLLFFSNILSSLPSSLPPLIHPIPSHLLIFFLLYFPPPFSLLLFSSLRFYYLFLLPFFSFSVTTILKAGAYHIIPFSSFLFLSLPNSSFHSIAQYSFTSPLFLHHAIHVYLFYWPFTSFSHLYAFLISPSFATFVIPRHS